MIQATEADRPAIIAFLEAHLPATFYPLTNLDHFGMGTKGLQMRFWLWRDGDRVTDVLAATGNGFLYPIFTTDVVVQAVDLLTGTQTIGLSGLPDQVAPMRSALGISVQPKLDFTEPTYHLPLDRLVMPNTGDLALSPLDAAPEKLMAGWRTVFLMETQSCLLEEAVPRAIYEMTEIRKRDTYRVLVDGDTPVALTGFNGAFPHVVQVGGVFTPPDLRSRGYARSAVALHLQQARAAGVRDAYLSAASAPAARAYEALGFRSHGHYSVVVYGEGQMIGG